MVEHLSPLQPKRDVTLTGEEAELELVAVQMLPQEEVAWTSLRGKIEVVEEDPTLPHPISKRSGSVVDTARREVALRSEKNQAEEEDTGERAEAEVSTETETDLGSEVVAEEVKLLVIPIVLEAVA